jgi:putative endonuclease
MWYAYVLLCSDTTFYTGCTTDPARRLHQHNHTKQGAAYTRSRRPVQMVMVWEAGSQSEALVMEARIRKIRDKRRFIISELVKHNRKDPMTTVISSTEVT